MNWQNRKLTFLVIVTALYMMAAAAHANPPSINSAVEKYVPAADQVGQAKLKVFVWHIYDATLLATQGQFSPEAPFALKLDYARKLYGDKIVETTLSEIRDQGFGDETIIEQWQSQLLTIIPDVDKDDAIIGIRDAQSTTHFYLNESKIGSIEDPLFTYHFFNIWLGNQSSQPEMRDQLLGLR
jgi:hypothetical protein